MALFSLLCEMLGTVQTPLPIFVMEVLEAECHVGSSLLDFDIHLKAVDNAYKYRC